MERLTRQMLAAFLSGHWTEVDWQGLHWQCSSVQDSGGGGAVAGGSRVHSAAPCRRLRRHLIPDHITHTQYADADADADADPTSELSR